jgi:hypothetical protein
MKNVVVLTHGISGSSLLAGLLARAGCWLGDETFKKPDYDTHENVELVRLNEQLMETLGYRGNYQHEFDSRVVDSLTARFDDVDSAPYRAFVEDCERETPWAWKDPRLTWTIRYWARLLDPRTTSYIVLTREDLQSWISANLRRHIQSTAFTRAYNHGINDSNRRFLADNGYQYLEMKYEEILLEPGPSLERLNRFLDTSLDIADLRAVHTGALHRRSRGLRDFMLASAIYLKNYGERDGRGRIGRSDAADRMMA